MVKLADFDLVREIRAPGPYVDGNRISMACYGTNKFVKAFLWVSCEYLAM